MGIWSDFCRELERAGACIDRPETPGDEIDRAEGYRYLTRLLRMGLDLTLEFADPRHPELILAQAKHFGDGGNTADCIYLHAVVDGRLRYRLHGTRGEAPLMEIGLYAGRIGLDPTSRRVDALREDQIVVGADGNIDVAFGDGSNATNTLRSEDAANYLFIRQYAHDWFRTRPASLRLEVVGDELADPAPANTAPLTLDATASSLQRAARFVNDAAVAWAAVVDNARRGPVNVFNAVPEDMDMTLPSGHRFAFGHFDLADDEALVVEFEPPEVPYWGLTINNYWFEVVDYGSHGSHLNNRTAEREGDGSVRVVISAQRPMVANWIDTRGHRVGALVFRWSRTALPLPALATRVVAVGDLATT
ncbi:MAG TPA: DUF1214 domain-containing protein [Acidimicrobiales bacterium]|nr:DUF1214 domain-containing protein [Acidimicrobiales bacterium]